MKYTHSIFAKLSSSQINRKQWAKHYKTDKLKEKWESRWYSFVIQKKALINNTTCRNEVVFVQILPVSTVDLLTIMPHEKKLPMPYTQHHKALAKRIKIELLTIFMHSRMCIWQLKAKCYMSECIKRPKFEHTSTIPERNETQGFLFGNLFL